MSIGQSQPSPDEEGLKYTYIQTDEVSNGVATVRVSATEARNIQKVVISADSYQTNDTFSSDWELAIADVLDTGGLSTGGSGGGAYIDGQDQLFLTGRILNYSNAEAAGGPSTQPVVIDLESEYVEWDENVTARFRHSESEGQSEPKMNCWIFWQPLEPQARVARRGD